MYYWFSKRAYSLFCRCALHREDQIFVRVGPNGTIATHMTPTSDHKMGHKDMQLVGRSNSTEPVWRIQQLVPWEV